MGQRCEPFARRTLPNVWILEKDAKVSSAESVPAELRWGEPEAVASCWGRSSSPLAYSHVFGVDLDVQHLHSGKNSWERAFCLGISPLCGDRARSFVRCHWKNQSGVYTQTQQQRTDWFDPFSTWLHRLSLTLELRTGLGGIFFLPPKKLGANTDFLLLIVGQYLN